MVEMVTNQEYEIELPDSIRMWLGSQLPKTLCITKSTLRRSIRTGNYTIQNVVVRKSDGRKFRVLVDEVEIQSGGKIQLKDQDRCIPRNYKHRMVHYLDFIQRL